METIKGFMRALVSSLNHKSWQWLWQPRSSVSDGCLPVLFSSLLSMLSCPPRSPTNSPIRPNGALVLRAVQELYTNMYRNRICTSPKIPTLWNNETITARSNLIPWGHRGHGKSPFWLAKMWTRNPISMITADSFHVKRFDEEPTLCETQSVIVGCLYW